MPVYEFTCRECRKKFQVVKPITEFDPKAVRCPKCRSKKVARLWGGVQVHTSKKS
jgi:putative FmdB family regulatory protein